MKAPIRLILLPLSILALTACASMDEQPDDYYAPTAEAAPSSDVDQAYVAAVENMARGRGIEVVWINMPPADDNDRE